jgi:tetratricopeptide (TPR) repeat protein
MRKQIENAINLYESGLAHGSSESAHQLGHLLNRKGEFKRSDEMFAKAIQLGEDSVAGCWVQSIYNSGRNDRKLFAKELLETHKPDEDSVGFSLLYAKILLWNGELQSSLEILTEQIRSIAQEVDDEFEDSKFSDRNFSELVEYFLLLIARRDYKVIIDLFEKSNEFDLKIMLKPVYYLLMNELKGEYPAEYLKAGKELGETINELQNEVEELRKTLI